MREHLSTLGYGRFTSRLVVALVLVALTSQAWASGWPPFAFRDSATVFRGGTVDTLDNGSKSVLDNDFDFEGDVLTAILDKDVKHGTLVLKSNGTFSYTHNGNNKKSDTFEYLAFDGTGESRKTRVTIEIEDVPNSRPTVTGEVEDQEAVSGSAYRLELAGYFSDPDEDDVLRFSARGLPSSNSLRLDEITGVLAGTPVDSDVRNNPYEVEITARDRVGASVSLTFDLTILEVSRADMALSINLVSNPVGVGETTKWNIQVQNNGPADLDEAQLTADWVTGGPSLNLSSPGSCAISANDTNAPAMSCSINSLSAGDSMTIQIDGTQSADGDNSVIGVLIADDPILDNNSDLVSSQVVAQFSEGPTQVVNLSGRGVATGDVSGDGEIDIVASDEQTLVFLNNGNRSVTTPGVSLGSGSGGTAVALLDWNADGSLDIAVGGLSARSAEIFVNDGSGGFTSAERLQNGGVGSVNDLIAADLNNDGRSDLVLAGSSGTLVMRSLSQGGFAQTSLSSGAGLDVEVADLDMDGDKDIIVVRQANRSVDIHYNNGNGNSFSRTRLNYGSVATVLSDDVNGDGTPDLLIGLDGNDLNPPQNKVYYRQSDGSFSAGGTFGASPSTALLSGDVNKDGRPDIVAVNAAGVHQLYLGSAGGAFSLAPEQIVSDGMRRGVLTDFNGDDSLDLIMVGRDAGVMEIHANNGVGKLGLGDRNAPSLQLIGETTISIAAGATFVDQGATALDDIDGDLTNRIKTTGEINTTVVGKQTISYQVSDRAGNTSSRVRTVNVGVNSGTGGSGGGVLAPAFVLMMSVLAVIRRRRANARVAN